MSTTPLTTGSRQLVSRDSMHAAHVSNVKEKLKRRIQNRQMQRNETQVQLQPMEGTNKLIKMQRP